MTLHFHQPYPGGRMILRCGAVDVDAVFPPVGADPGRNPWVWRLWVGMTPTATKDGRTATEQAAKNAALASFRDWLAAADLKVME